MEVSEVVAVVTMEGTEGSCPREQAPIRSVQASINAESAFFLINLTNFLYDFCSRRHF